LRSGYEAHHGVHYPDASLRAAAELAAKYITDRHLPDKAIDVIDEAGASWRLKPEAVRGIEITPADIEETIAKMTQLPPQSVSASDEQLLASLEPRLKAVIFGQDRAIEAVVSAIKLNRSGLGPVNRPIGSFLFSGPTGVGKTELAKQLAQALGVAFIRFDMSEYMEKHTVSRLIGAPPGYVGFDQGGLLTDAIRKQPYAVLLLDEIEKAHQDVFNLLLQVMDHATLTDNNGRKTDFRHVILIMTTNAGAQDLSARAIGFGSSALVSLGAAAQRKAIESTFSPEFRNRLDAWIPFDPLPFEVILQVADKLIDELSAQLVSKGVILTVSAEARVWLAEHGFDPKFGARPMRRLIDEHVRKPLAELLLFGSLKHGGQAELEIEQGSPKIYASGAAGARVS
jgi:ATP-dependent Clp protease ATP-binding subunit ClpA